MAAGDTVPQTDNSQCPVSISTISVNNAAMPSADSAVQQQTWGYYLWHRFCICLFGLTRRRIRNESLFVMSLVQALCATAALILSAVAATRSKESAGSCVFARLIAGAVILTAACHGIATSRRKQFGTVLGLFVLCQAACLASLILLSCSGIALHAYIVEAHQYFNVAQSTISSRRSPPDLADLITSGLAMLLSLMELGVALSCCLACGRQLRPRDSRIMLDPRGNGLIVSDFGNRDFIAIATTAANSATNSSRIRSRCPPPPPHYAAVGTPPPAYSTVDRRRWRRHRPHRPVSADASVSNTASTSSTLADDGEAVVAASNNQVSSCDNRI
ncbi:hypothetical protein BOX15_Mlig005484g3 [Macrostomum lignano]|uniref:Uncharacterized protein n=1 Tax=Macrostomum lignano TaxID=282301 RepID=A0A267GGB4_9PLAT|nr:hypothetical protein BOX15_Mlig005484g3 [Macrostomum lignano]